MRMPSPPSEFEGATDGIAVFIPDEEPFAGRILYVNDAFVRMSGYSAEQLVGHSAMLLAGARPDFAYVSAAVAAVSQRKSYEAKARKFRPDGTSFDAVVHVDPFGEERQMILVQRQV